MSRSRKHSQRPTKRDMTCPNCKWNNCAECVDVVLILAGRPTVCTCTRRCHSGEPIDQQVLDPFTGTVHAPGLEVAEDGTITRH